MLAGGADLESGKKPANRNCAQILPDVRGVMPRNVVKPRPARDAIEIQAERGRGGEPGFQFLKCLFKIVARAFRVAQYQADRVAPPRVMRDGERTVFLAGP